VFSCFDILDGFLLQRFKVMSDVFLIHFHQKRLKDEQKPFVFILIRTGRSRFCLRDI